MDADMQDDVRARPMALECQASRVTRGNDPPTGPGGRGGSPAPSPAMSPATASGDSADVPADSGWRGADDVALVLAVATSRDRAAFVALFGRFAPRLKSWYLRTGSPAGEAEDLAQETMLAVWRKAEGYDPARAGAATWIFTIARNLRIDAVRRMPRQALDPEDPSLVPGAPASPESGLQAAELEDRLRAALNALPSGQADVIRLSFFEDRPHAEIERVLGIPLGTVKSRLRLAMNRLRAHLLEYQPPRPGESANGERP
jgi:RNA polymerase sigma-70 factor (ECF subfamily)